MAFSNNKISQTRHESEEGNQDKTDKINKPNSDPSIWVIKYLTQLKKKNPMITTLKELGDKIIDIRKNQMEILELKNTALN